MPFNWTNRRGITFRTIAQIAGRPQISRPDFKSSPSELAAWTLEASLPTRRSTASTYLGVLSASLHTVGLKVI